MGHRPGLLEYVKFRSVTRCLPSLGTAQIVARPHSTGDSRAQEFWLVVAGICILGGSTSPQAEMEVRMAQQVNVKFVDDLDGSDAAGTVSFRLDGRSYEIDLSDDNAARLRNILASFTGRRAQEQQISHGGQPPRAQDRVQTAAIRAWARQNGHQVSRPRPHLEESRGRLPGRPLTQPPGADRNPDDTSATIAYAACGHMR